MAHAAALALVSVFVLVLAMAGCGRTSLEPEKVDAGTTPSTTCGPSTCPGGCCDATGACRTGSDVNACGSVGETCSNCITGGFTFCTTSRVCGREDPLCSSATCSGCCTVDAGRLRCLSGTEPSACGRAGGQCSNCSASGRSCDTSAGTCGTAHCDATNCPGCCVADQCEDGVLAPACGHGGVQCATCQPGQQCTTALSPTGGTCTGTVLGCDATNCDGCCDASGACQTGLDTTACGHDGQACGACTASEACVLNATVVGGSCEATATCGAQNCADGCCDGNTCVTPPNDGACGFNGEQCGTCGTSETCNAVGQCVATGDCNAKTCPSGCCVGDICAVGSQATACGTSGAACQNCLAVAEVCKAGSCVPAPCGPATCPSGCCSGNTCVSGTDNKACGKQGGGACTDCTASGQSCQGQVCVAACGPSNCSGCCNDDNTCDPLGIDNTACGQGGAACSDCSSRGAFCDGLVSPRQCSDQQTTCPAPYGFCSAATTEPIIAATQKVCSNANLDTLTTACAGGPTSGTCQAAFTALPATCRSCLTPFDVAFDQKLGLWACAAAFVTNNCRHSLGCAADCVGKSCVQCTASSGSQCTAQVGTFPFGQCAPYTGPANCAAGTLASGVCSQFSYSNFGTWFRGVGDHFCGDGP